MRIQIIAPAFAVVALLGLTACTVSRGNPPGTEATRALDRTAGTNVSGAYPGQSDGTPGNPSGTVIGRAFDRVAGTDTAGTAANPPGTAASRAADRVRARAAARPF